MKNLNFLKWINWNRVQFSDSWFVFRDSSWGFHKPYFSKKHIFHESYRANRIMVLKLSNKYQIIWQCYNFKNIIVDDHSLFFTKSKISNWKDEKINHPNIYYYYLIYSGNRKSFRKIMQKKEFWFVL